MKFSLCPIHSFTCSQLSVSGVELTCVDCVMNTNVSIGIDFAATLNGDCLTTSDSCFSLDAAAMNFTVEDFEQVAALEVFIGANLTAGISYEWGSLHHTVMAILIVSFSVFSIPVGPALMVSELR